MKFYVVGREGDLEVTNMKASEIYEITKDTHKYLTLEDLEGVVPKFKAIQENMERIYNQAVAEANATKASINGVPAKKVYLKEAEEIKKCRRVELDTDMAYDEFYLCYLKGEILPNSCCHIEVVTKEVAEGNDMDWLRATPELSSEIKNYKVGEVLSDYRKLGNSEYYFKFM